MEEESESSCFYLFIFRFELFMKVEINQLTKQYDNKTVLNIEHLDIEKPGIVGLVGNNGAGKTTLFMLMLDLLRATSGTINYHIDEQLTYSSTENDKWKPFVGAFVDNSFLIDFLTADEYLCFIAQLSNISNEQLENHLTFFSRFIGADIWGSNMLIRNLSAGNKQKVGIVAAFLLHPSLVLLDEPFNFLDPSSQNILKHLLQAYCEEHQAIVIISSHNIQHTIDISQRILLLEKGNIIRDLDNTNKVAEAELQTYFES